eukprot:SAG31_NODE_2800_length_5077_cov_2.098433_10_plen_111_part_00
MNENSRFKFGSICVKWELPVLHTVAHLGWVVSRKQPLVLMIWICYGPGEAKLTIITDPWAGLVRAAALASNSHGRSVSVSATKFGAVPNRVLAVHRMPWKERSCDENHHP